MEGLTREERIGYAAQVLRRMEGLAAGRVNDAVKLAFLDGEQMADIDSLDLAAVTEFKRGSNGTVEIKLTDRMAVLEKMLTLLDGREERADAFLKALEGGGEPGR